MGTKVLLRPLASSVTGPLPSFCPRSTRAAGCSFLGARFRQVGTADCAIRKGETVALTWIRTHDWDADEWRDQLPLLEQHFESFGAKFPEPLRKELVELKTRLDAR